MAAPTTILLKASDGASDYANKFGEPLLAGFARSNGFRQTGVEAEAATGIGNVAGESARGGSSDVSVGERREWLRPIMFSAGVGFLDDTHTKKVSQPPLARTPSKGWRAMHSTRPLRWTINFVKV